VVADTQVRPGSARQTAAEAMPHLRFEILGPVRAWHHDTELDLGSPQQHAVLAILLLSAGRQVSMEILIDAIWGQAPPRAALGTIRTYISRLRRCLDEVTGERGAEVLRSVGDGYIFQIGATVDLELFTAQVRQARLTSSRGDLTLAAEQLGQALELWHGMPLAGIAGPYADSQRARLLELRMAATEDRLSLAVESGGHSAAIGELRALRDEHPLRERLTELLMLALYRAGRQADALAMFADSRRLLRDELGVDPGPALRAVHERILRADGSLTSERPAPSAAPPAQLPPPRPDFTGRSDLLGAIVACIADGPAPSVAAITGMPGVGKTLLALQAAHTAREAFDGGQLYAELSAAPDALDEVLTGFRRALGHATGPDALPEPGAAERSERASRRVLVVLDGVRDAAQARPLLLALRGCAVIMTTQRRMLDLPGARWFEVEPLPADEAMQLLERLVGQCRVGAERAAAERLVTATAGQPTAIRAAAARLVCRPAWSIADMVSQLEEELCQPEITHPDCELVEAPFERAYGHLPGDQAFVFRQAALADRPEVSVAAVAAVTGMSENRALGALESLADAHLIQAAEFGRYRYHPLVKLYAWRKALAEGGHRACQPTVELLRQPSAVVAR
jgi:DNA-binding SARP family transcriptional activator